MGNIITNALDAVAPKEDNMEAMLQEIQYNALCKQFNNLTNNRVLGNKTDKHMEIVLTGKQKIANLVARFKK